MNFNNFPTLPKPPKPGLEVANPDFDPSPGLGVRVGSQKIWGLGFNPNPQPHPKRGCTRCRVWGY